MKIDNDEIQLKLFAMDQIGAIVEEGKGKGIDEKESLLAVKDMLDAMGLDRAW